MHHRIKRPKLGDAVETIVVLEQRKQNGPR